MRNRDGGQRAHPVGVAAREVPADERAPVVADDVHVLDPGGVEQAEQVAGQLGQRVRGRVLGRAPGEYPRWSGAISRSGTSAATRIRASPSYARWVCGKPCSSRTGRPSGAPCSATSKTNPPTGTRRVRQPPSPRLAAPASRRPEPRHRSRKPPSRRRSNVFLDHTPPLTRPQFTEYVRIIHEYKVRSQPFPERLSHGAHRYQSVIKALESRVRFRLMCSFSCWCSVTNFRSGSNTAEFAGPRERPGGAGDPIDPPG
jgi:hypothetical protein